MQIRSLSSSQNELLFHRFHIKLLGTDNSSLSSKSTIAVDAIGFSFYLSLTELQKFYIFLSGVEKKVHRGIFLTPATPGSQGEAISQVVGQMRYCVLNLLYLHLWVDWKSSLVRRFVTNKNRELNLNIW